MKNETEIDKYCAYCENAEKLADEEYVLCKIKGVVLASFRCRRFVYDPLKRIPKRPPKLNFESEI